MSNDDSEVSQDLEQLDEVRDPLLLERYWERLNEFFASSRVPFLLIGVLCALAIAKVLLLLSLEWMIVEEVFPDYWLYLNPYDASDIAGTPDILLALANRWDSQHFLEIARNGYPSGVENDLLFAFAPVYPWMVAMIGQVVDNLYLAGVVVSNAFYFLSIIAFYKVARMYMDYEKSCLLALVFGMFPTYLTYGTLAYSEAPFLFFAIASWYFFKEDQYLPCAIFTTLTILTRYISGLLVLIYGVIILSNLIDKYKKEKSFLKAFDFRLLWFAIPVICVTAVFLYFQSLTGSFFAAFDAHAWFGDSLTTPFHQFRWFFEGYFTDINPGVEPILLMLQRYMFTIPYLVLTLILLKDDAELGLYGVLFMWITLSMEGISGLASPRIMLSAWVAFLALKGRMSSALYIVMAVMFFFVGIWVMYQFQLTFFA
ncbi:MAG: glycosyltransferase family 39 protein [Candidatus Thorarchaeota archaeon]|nr:glycosyltransferase family 39 protein [Candidatus Thorarchaeota archaeon]